jgi:DNA end-binding protein Ku
MVSYLVCVGSSAVPLSRAYWNGYLKFALVSCPVALYPATSAAERLSFRQINRRTGHRLKHKLVDTVTGETVDSANKARGYEVGENEFLLVEDRDIDRARSARPDELELVEPPRVASPTIMPATSHERGQENASEDGDEYKDEGPPIPRPQNTRTIEISRFLPSREIDARYFEKPYYVTPREEIGQEPFAVLRDAMRREEVVGLARVVLSSRARPFLIEPMGKGFRGFTLRFAHEVRAAEDYFADIPEMKFPAEMMTLAQHIIKSKLGEFDESLLQDHYRRALTRILKEKQAKHPARQLSPVKPSPENVVNLMDALRRSIAADRPAPSQRAKAVSRRRPERARKSG